MDGGEEIAALGDWPAAAAPLFVKPNTLGAKIGIFADSLCQTPGEAVDRAKLIRSRYRDRALIQPFVEGDDVRVSFIDLGGDLADQLGVERIVKDPASETRGAFLTMKDNETLSGARDAMGARGGFGRDRRAAFVPRMVDLRGEADEPSRGRSGASSTPPPGFNASLASATVFRSISASTRPAALCSSSLRSVRP